MQTICQPQENRPNANQIVQPNLQPKQPPLMKIKFKKKRLIYNLVFSILYIVIGLDGIINQENIRWTKYVFFIIGTIYLISSLFEIRNQYLTIENGMIRKNILFGKNEKINLKDIAQIMEFRGEYKLITEQTLLKFNPELIEPNSLEELYAVLKKLDIPADKTPFPKENNEIQLPQL